MEYEELKKILRLNKKYEFNNNNGIKDAAENFMIIHGNIPILLSAPHAVRQNRKGIEKGADVITGPIVEYLCEKTGATGIIRTCNFNDDPNSENEGYGLQYKNAILKLIKENDIMCMIDVHGCRDRAEFDIDIGTNNGININETDYIDIMKRSFSEIAKVTVDNKFKSSMDITVCKYIHEKSGIPCFQIEICKELRKNPLRLIQLLESFQKIIGSLTKEMVSLNYEELEL